MTGWDYSLKDYGIRVWRVNGCPIYFQKGEWKEEWERDS